MHIVETVSSSVVEHDFKGCCSMLREGGVLIVEERGEPEAVILSPLDYEDYKAMKNREYLGKLDRAEEQFERGEYVTLTAEQLAAL